MLEKFLTSLMQQAGVNPEQIMQAYQMVLRWDAEIQAFKQGAGGAMTHVNARLDKLENELAYQTAQLFAIHQKLDELLDRSTVPQSLKPNGEDHHGQRSE